MRGQDRLGYYVAQYDGEIATVDQEVGRVMEALGSSAAAGKTVMVLTSDHGESLGEHDYYFDHGEDLFEPSLAVPLIVVAPGGKAGLRSRVFASTLDVLPTILDAVKVSYPPELAGISLLGEVTGRSATGRPRLFAQNDRNSCRAGIIASGSWGRPPPGHALRALRPGERPRRDPRRGEVPPGRAEGAQRGLEAFMAAGEREWTQTQRLLGSAPEGTG